MVSLLKIKELQKITGGWVCRCSRFNGRYIYMSENSCKQLCCKDVLVDYYKFGVDPGSTEVTFCSKEAQITVQIILKEMALIQKLKANDFETSDSFDLVL